MSDFICCTSLSMSWHSSASSEILSASSVTARARVGRGARVASPGSISGMHAPHMTSWKGRGRFANTQTRMHACTRPHTTDKGIDESLLSHTHTHTGNPGQPPTARTHMVVSHQPLHAQTSHLSSVCVCGQPVRRGSVRKFRLVKVKETFPPQSSNSDTTDGVLLFLLSLL